VENEGVNEGENDGLLSVGDFDGTVEIGDADGAL